jgi:hypothetical protein
MIKLKDPIVFGFICSIVIYYILYLEFKSKNNNNKNNNNNIPLKLPIIVGILVWGSTSYFINDENIVSSNSIPDINQEIYTNPADF